MFIVTSNSGFVYTGRAGDGWVSANRGEAFAYSSAIEAMLVMARFNRMSAIHGHNFTVEKA